jgi:hypothetical protein
MLDDGPGLRERRAILGDDRRLAERMHLAQRWRREHRRGIALIALHLVVETELLEEPQHSLRARIVQVMDRYHR